MTSGIATFALLFVNDHEVFTTAGNGELSVEVFSSALLTPFLLRRAELAGKTVKKLIISNLVQRESHSHNIAHPHHSGSAKQNART
jgi:hypothetical protein